MSDDTRFFRWNDLAQEIARARASGELIEFRSAADMPRTIEAGYYVQDRTISLLGIAPCGWKLGATSPVAQRTLGLAEPFSGPVFADVQFQSPARIDASGFSCHLFEPEIAIRLAHDIDRPLSRGEAYKAIASYHPAIEIINFRFREGRSMNALGMICDFGANGCLVLGAAAPPEAYDYKSLHLDVKIDGRTVAHRESMPAETDPVELLAWFSKNLTQRGYILRAGDLITTGSQAGIIPYKVGHMIEADFGSVGRAVFHS